MEGGRGCWALWLRNSPKLKALGGGGLLVGRGLGGGRRRVGLKEVVVVLFEVPDL